MNTILPNPLVLLRQLRSGSRGPPTLFFILRSKYNSHEGRELAEDLFNYYDLASPGSNLHYNPLLLTVLDSFPGPPIVSFERNI